MFRTLLTRTTLGVSRPITTFPISLPINAAYSSSTTSSTTATTSHSPSVPVGLSTNSSVLPQPPAGPRPRVWPYGRDLEGNPNPAVPTPKIIREELPDYDLLRNNEIIEQLVNTLFRHGQKTKMRGIVSKALEMIQEQTGGNPIQMVEEAIIKATPIIKSFRGGGRVRVTQIPRPLTQRQGRRLAIVWLHRAAEKRKERSMEERLAAEIINVYNGTSSVNKMKSQMHIEALRNRANAQIRL